MRLAHDTVASFRSPLGKVCVSKGQPDVEETVYAAASNFKKQELAGRGIAQTGKVCSAY